MTEHAKRADRQITSLVKQYSAEYGREACLSSIVRSWLRANSASSRVANQYSHIQRAVEIEPANDLEAQMIAATSGEFTLKQTEVAFESLNDAGNKRSEGTVYTPNYVIDYIVKRCFEIRSATNPPKLIDPACGSGGFLMQAIPLMSERYGIFMEEAINEFICGIDVNEDAIECAKLSIELFCAGNSVTAPSSFDFLIHRDSLMTPKTEVMDTFGIEGDGFDIVVTNPPYVKLQNLDDGYRHRLCERYPEFTMGSFSLAMLFLVAGYDLLSHSGVLGYITQNNIYTSLAGEGVRDFLQNRRSVHTIVDFGHKKIFPRASAYTCLMFLDRRPQQKLRFYRCDDPELQLPALQSGDFHGIEISGLRKDKWRLAPERHLRNLRKLESVGSPLGQLADIRVGFATLKDSVFLIDDDDRSSIGIERDLTTPAIKIANFYDEKELDRNSLRIIRPYQKIGNQWLPLREDDFQNRYPRAYAYLKSHEHELSMRDKGKRPLPQFFEWGRSQGMEAPGPKLLTKTFNRGPNFLLDKTDSLFCNGYSVKPKEIGDLFSNPIDIRVLQKILNSCVMDYYARLTSFQIEGGYQCFQKNFIERFCIPRITPDQSDSILRLDGVSLQRRMCELFGLDYHQIMEIVPH